MLAFAHLVAMAIASPSVAQRLFIVKAPRRSFPSFFQTLTLHHALPSASFWYFPKAML